MTFKFSDIMKKFYEDEKLGIQKEDAPRSILSLGVELIYLLIKSKIKKRKKRKIFMMEERKEARQFFKRIEQLRAKRDKTFREKVKENINSFGEEYLLENNVDILRKIVKRQTEYANKDERWSNES